MKVPFSAWLRSRALDAVRCFDLTSSMRATTGTGEHERDTRDGHSSSW